MKRINLNKIVMLLALLFTMNANAQVSFYVNERIFFVTVQSLHSYEQKSIKNRLWRWDFCLPVSGFSAFRTENTSRDSGE